MSDLYDYDHCYECQGYGDDYYFNDDGELVSACDDCPFNDDYWEANNGGDDKGHGDAETVR